MDVGKFAVKCVEWYSDILYGGDDWLGLVFSAPINRKDRLWRLTNPLMRAVGFSCELFEWNFEQKGGKFIRTVNDDYVNVFSGYRPDIVGTVGARVWRDERDGDKLKYDVVRSSYWCQSSFSDHSVGGSGVVCDLEHLLASFDEWAKWGSSADTVREDVRLYFPALLPDGVDIFTGELPLPGGAVANVTVELEPVSPTAVTMYAHKKLPPSSD